MLAGIIGKPNVGKSTFFNAATLMNVPVANYPFTTIKPNFGTAYIRVKCIHEELHVTDNPVNSACVKGTRLIPVRLVDVAGLVQGASTGRGLGNKFLDDLRQADALIHVVDASGSTDEEGRAVPPGSHDPMSDIEFVEREFVLWLKSILQKDWSRIARTVESGAQSESMVSMLLQKLSGLSMTESSIEEAVRRADLKADRPTTWTEEDLENFCRMLLSISKPYLIVANKCDEAASENLISSLVERFGSTHLLVPCAAEAELVLRRASEKGLVDYIPGDESFAVRDNATLSHSQLKALDLIRSRVFHRWKGTGVQQAINYAYLRLLKGIVVYPVEDETKFSDKKGNVLPDARVMHEGDTARDLAFQIHTDIGNNFLYAVNARTGLRLGADYELRNNDVIKVVTSARKT